MNVTLDGESAATIYQKRWKVEEFHKSLKSNAALGKSPTQTVTTQNNHVLVASIAVFELERPTVRHQGYAEQVARWREPDFGMGRKKAHISRKHGGARAGICNAAGCPTSTSL